LFAMKSQIIEFGGWNMLGRVEERGGSDLGIK
jgi:hypothetical protein